MARRARSRLSARYHRQILRTEQPWVGTASVHLLLDHLEVLKRLEAFAATCEFWQALITVTSTKTDAHPIIGSSRMIGLAISNNIICERVRVI
jgi:hypothetical protein